MSQTNAYTGQPLSATFDRPWQKTQAMPINLPTYNQPQYNGTGFTGMAQQMAMGQQPSFSGLNRVNMAMQQRQPMQQMQMQQPMQQRMPQQAMAPQQMPTFDGNLSQQDMADLIRRNEGGHLSGDLRRVMNEMQMQKNPELAKYTNVGAANPLLAQIAQQISGSPELASTALMDMLQKYGITYQSPKDAAAKKGSASILGGG